jgi:hypothetical protein
MSASVIQMQIWAGMGYAADVLGFPYQQYRPVTAIDPLSGAPLNPALLVAVSAKPNRFYTAPTYGRPERFLALDGTQTQVGDYLVGGPVGTLAIISQDPMLPIAAILCNRVLTVKRPSTPASVGAQSEYGGDVAANETVLLQSWPAYLGTAGHGGHGPVGLVGDVDTPRIDIRFPILAGVTLLNGDVIYDDQSRRYKIVSAEATTLGWKIGALLSMT